MKKIIKYYYIKSDHIFASPEYDHEEIVEVENEQKLKDYIESKKDDYGCKFEKSKKKTFGFDFISKYGGVKVLDYKKPIIKKI